VFGEMWDNYQLRSLAHGGNKNLNTILKEYKLEKKLFIKSYNHPALVWYRKHHMAKMDMILFVEPRPTKNLQEKIDKVQDAFTDDVSIVFDTVSENLFDQVSEIDWKETFTNSQDTFCDKVSDKFDFASHVIEDLLGMGGGRQVEAQFVDKKQNKHARLSYLTMGMSKLFSTSDKNSDIKSEMKTS